MHEAKRERNRASSRIWKLALFAAIGMISIAGYADPRATPPSEVFSRTRSFLDHVGIAEESSRQSEFDDLQGKISETTLREMIGKLEFKGGESSHYWKIESDSHGTSNWIVYQDREGFSEEDFRVRLAPSTATSRTLPNHMSGLRIALDPGHMGTPEWDVLGQKYVRAPDGTTLSEGLLVLELSYLLKERFEKLGSIVALTREVPGTVVDDYSTFDPKPYVQEKIRNSVDAPWFLKLASTLSGPGLWKAIQTSSQYKEILSTPKSQYYILGSDLDARVKKFEDFKPDLALILHMDTNGPPKNPTGIGAPTSATKAYVQGGFMDGDFASRDNRAIFGQIVLRPNVWQESVDLSKSIIDEIHTRMKIGYSSVNRENARPVVPGVQMRNLRVQKKVPTIPSAYLESLFYSDPTEFRLLTTYKYEMEIGGKKYPYSERLVELADSIAAGVIRYVE